MTQSRLIGIAGLIAWLMVGLTGVLYHAGEVPNRRWILAFLLFGALFAADLRRPRLLLVAIESLTVLALMLLSCKGYEGVLLALVAMQLGSRLERAAGILWIGVQTALLAAAMLAIQLSPLALGLLLPPYLGFQLVAFFTFNVMAREVAARTELATANAELRAVQEILAESSRMAERLRIAHELHDALGHRLTALTLNLEAALRRTDGPAKANVEMAQSLARQLLGEVREIVADSRARDGVHVAHALQALVGSVPRPRVHLEVAESLRIADPERAHILLRCTQEIVTNSARHSGAENLWIVIERDGDSFRILAHDDGRGSDGASDGFGLRGMRERVERAGGELRIATQPGRGFDVTAMLPVRGGAA